MKRIGAFVLAGVLLAGTSVQASLSSYENYPVPTVARPALDAAFVDPTFGETVIRTTDPSQSPDDGANTTKGLVHEYSRFPAVNADNTKLVLQVLGGINRGAWQVRSLATHALLNRIDTQGDPEFSWSPTDPNLLFYRYKNQVRLFHADTNTAETLLTLEDYVSLSSGGEGRPSDAWTYYAALGVKSSGERDLLVLDLKAKRVLSTTPAVGSAGIDWVSMSPLGNYVVVMWTNGADTRVYDRTLTFQRVLLSDFAHSDFALDAAGDEVLVYEANTGKQLTEVGCPNAPIGSPFVSVRLEDAEKKIILGECSNADWGMVVTGTYIGWGLDAHFSGISSRTTPGWVLISTYQDPTAAQQPFAQEIFAVELNGSGAVKRLVHHHSVVTTEGGVRDYYAEPHATGSWNGGLVFFVSNWASPQIRYDVYRMGATTPIPPVPPVLRAPSGTLALP
jgi:hypothetical protein